MTRRGVEQSGERRIESPTSTRRHALGVGDAERLYDPPMWVGGAASIREVRQDQALSVGEVESREVESREVESREVSMALGIVGAKG